MIDARSELYAGGECGLLVLSRPGDEAQWRPLLEDAEARGLSGLLTADPRGVVELSALGVRHVVLVADASRLGEALALAGRSPPSALCLLSPQLPDDPGARYLVSKLRLPRLLLSSSDAADVQATRRFDAHSAGAVAMRFLPLSSRGIGMFADPSKLAPESICLFALRTANTALRRHPHPGLAA